MGIDQFKIQKKAQGCRNLRAGSAPFFIFRKTAPRVGRTLTVAVYAVAVHTDHVHVFLFSARTTWQLDERGNTGEVLDERYRVVVAF